MSNINFNHGIKTYTINGNENCTISFNPSDFSILSRIKDAVPKMEAAAKKYEAAKNDGFDDIAAMIKDCDTEIRDCINEIFNADVCSGAFGNTHCMTLCGGKQLWENFMDAVLPVIEADIKTEMRKSEENIEKYTSQVSK